MAYISVFQETPVVQGISDFSDGAQIVFLVSSDSIDLAPVQNKASQQIMHSLNR